MKNNFEIFENFTEYFWGKGQIFEKMTKFQTLSDFDNIWYTSVIIYVEFNNGDQF